MDLRPVSMLDWTRIFSAFHSASSQFASIASRRDTGVFCRT